jgi:hypothetical protein
MRIPRILLLATSVSACGGGEPITLGLEEPLRVSGAQFVAGDLPGRKPLTAEQLTAGTQPKKPFPTSPEVAGRILTIHETGFVVNGRASTDSHALGFQLEGFGSGYWLLPAGAPDPANNGELSYRATLSFGSSLEPGLQTLRVAAIDGEGRSGTQREVELCFRSPVQDNLNACDPHIEPPALVVSLAWSNNADLDLRVIAADGSSITQSQVNGEAGTLGGALERDANSGCVLSGDPRENIVWQEQPKPGLYFVYVNLSDTCGEGTTTFSVSTHVAEEDGEEFRQVETFRVPGQVTPLHANGGRELGQFITEFRVN